MPIRLAPCLFFGILIVMLHIPRIVLTKKQYHYFASALKTIAESIMIGSLGAFFLPETLQMKTPIAPERFAILFVSGLTCLLFGAILEKKG